MERSSTMRKIPTNIRAYIMTWELCWPKTTHGRVYSGSEYPKASSSSLSMAIIQSKWQIYWVFPIWMKIRPFHTKFKWDKICQWVLTSVFRHLCYTLLLMEREESEYSTIRFLFLVIWNISIGSSTTRLFPPSFSNRLFSR